MGRKKHAFRAGSSHTQIVARVEPLEVRRLMAVDIDPDIGVTRFDLGTLEGRAYLTGKVGDVLEFIEGYRFLMPRAGRADVLLSRVGPLQNRTLAIGGFAVGPSSGELQLSTPLLAGSTDTNIRLSFSGTGPFEGASYTLAIATDFAGGGFDGTNFETAFARDIGTLSTAPAKQVRDFVGFLDTADRPGADKIDTYVFDIPKSGSVAITLDGVGLDPAGGFVSVDADLYRDSDRDGLLEPNERLDTENATTNEIRTLSGANLSTGQYAVVVRSGFGAAAGSNYRLTFNYSVVDTAGGTLATARNIGTLGVASQVFDEYLSSADTSDIYRFSTQAGGPFSFRAIVSGMPAGADFELDLIRDVNGNGAIDFGETIATSFRASNFAEEMIVPLTIPGTYFVRVRRDTGEGVYRLQMNNANADVGGNTLGTAQVIGNLFGFVNRADFVSDTDPVDTYKFTITQAATVRASFPATALGTDANLQLIRDANSDGAISATEVISQSAQTGNAGESISRSLAAGTYFVRVLRSAGRPFYDMTISSDTAGSTLATSRLMALDSSTGESLGPGDPSDFFALDVTRPLQLGVFLDSLSDTTGLRVGRDANSNGVLDAAELLVKQTVSGITFSQVLNLTTTGRYFVVIDSAGVTADNYGIVFANAPIDNAGNTPAAARNVGAVNATVRTFSDFVGDGSRDPLDDNEDYYRFDPGSNGPFRGRLEVSTSGGALQYQLIRDANGDNLVEPSEIILTRSVSAGATAVSDPPLNEPGPYLVRVVRTSGQATYRLSLSATTTDTAGNSLSAARNLGTLTNALTVSETVAPIDRDDFFRFSVGSAGQLAAAFVGTSPSADIAIIRDIDNDNVIDSGEILGNTFARRVSAGLSGVFLPAAGTYFARVQSFAGIANYTLSLNFSNQTPFGGTPINIASSGSTKIEIENFDNGGEGVAYHDATPTNDGGAFRTGDSVELKSTVDTGGGFRAANTAPGEFIEYSINVLTAGTYDFDFRVSSPDPGATFHVEIDNINVTGSVSIPDTNSFDAMTTVSRIGMLLDAGPHVLRLSMDGDTTAADNFAGSFNFITLRPSSLGTGTFVLDPPNLAVQSGKNFNLNLGWTVPSGGWRLLRNMELRLRDEQGVAFQLKWDEAAGSLSLFNPATGRYGSTGVLGRNNVLSNSAGQIFLKHSRTQAAGPQSPTVTLSLDMQLKNSLANHRFIVEVTAADDLGNSDPWRFAGTLTVSR